MTQYNLKCNFYYRFILFFVLDNIFELYKFVRQRPKCFLLFDEF